VQAKPGLPAFVSQPSERAGFARPGLEPEAIRLTVGWSQAMPMVISPYFIEGF
jgi:hypothetical protein